MAKGHNDDEAEKERATESTSGKGRTNRRTFMKTVGAAVALGGSASLIGRASAVSDLDAALNPSGEVTLDAGEYSWGGGMDIGAGNACIGGGSKGDTVLNLESGTMSGSVEGRLENVVVRGANPEPKAGIDLSPGATLDGFVWPEGGRQSEDRALYTPDGGNDRLTIRNSAWARMANNGAYVDKPPVTMENCVSVNNNIAGVRVGHRDGTDTSETTYVRNTLIAVTDSIPSDDTNSPNARGLRLRSPANLVVENCWFVYFDVDGNADLVELHDEAAGSTVTIRNCTFYNDSDGDLVRDKSGGEMDVTIENCTVAGSGSRTVEPDFSGSGISEADEVSVPVPSQITGYAAADDIEGLDLSVSPWDGSASAPSEPSEPDNTLVLHATPDNDGAADVSFTVDGTVEFAAEAEPDTDTIVENDDGTTTATSVGLAPDELDSYRFSGGVVDYSVPDGTTVDVSVNGTTTTFAELTGESSADDGADGSDGSDGSDDSSDAGDADVLEVIAQQSGDLNYEFVVDGSVELHRVSSDVVAGHGDSITENGDGTVTVTGFTGNTGFGDAYLVDGTITSFSADPADYDFDVVLNGESVDPSAFDGSASGGADDQQDGSSGDGSDDSTGDDGSADGGSSDDGQDGSSGGSQDGSSGDDSSGSDSSGDSESDSLPHLLTVDGESDVTTYTFTVSGDVARDPDESVSTGDGTSWDAIEDIAKDGKVIGLVGSGADAYRFGGAVTEITVDGDAAVSIERNA
ncbi:right-handed parallel beta-helix repeat-containing protein [Halobacterium litoreum]|uniref:Right-handed parallel beta-helix repeat-containing protein n=1 Tax=Halobacterium litoreum TaxID=2039234 RepID=A0ABD5NBL5_9EURY|nr:right-handed parallel beta-helix repeat-containing protein [Halobacterium litoreum]UHH14639.1 right-handed parallel beta-helix repeat-containing protein [Halobacterium litoreum]